MEIGPNADWNFSYAIWVHRIPYQLDEELNKQFINFSDGTRESSIVTKMFLVEEAVRERRRSEDEMSEEFQEKHEVMKSSLRLDTSTALVASAHHSHIVCSIH